MSTEARVGPLALSTLAEVARALAAQPERWKPLVHRGSRSRWYEPLARSDEYEAWLLGWPRHSSLELHDHGGASGAVHVLQGRLHETWWDRPAELTVGPAAPDFGTGRLSTRVLRRAETVAFGPDHVHDVRALNRRDQALSIHVYAPRLASLTFYDHSAGALHALFTQPQPHF